VEVTNSAFKQVGVSSGKVVALMGEIAAASREQSEGIEQVNKAVVDMNSTTQRNAASAEELAAAMAMFKTDHANAQGAPHHKNRFKGTLEEGKRGKRPAALPEETGGGGRF
jgi:methyl-accepting chemotaxis protein